MLKYYRNNGYNKSLTKERKLAGGGKWSFPQDKNCGNVENVMECEKWRLAEDRATRAGKVN